MSWFNDLAEDKDLANQEDALGLRKAPPPSAFRGFWGAAAAGVPRGILEGTAPALEGFGQMMGRAAASGSSRGLNDDQDTLDMIIEPTTDAADATMDAAQEFRADADVGLPGQIANEMAAIIPRTILGTAAGGPVGGAIAAGAPAGLSESVRLQDEGIDEATADRIGLLTGITTGVGALIPGSGAFKTVVGKLGATVGGNVALGAVQRYGTSEALADAGYDAQAQQYRVMDGKALAADAVLGLLFFGVDVGANAVRRPSRSQVDAALGDRQARHAAVDTAPGIPTDPAAARAHTQRLEEAVRQALAGERVNVADAVEGAFLPQAADIPAAAPRALDPVHADTRGSTLDLILALETRGNADAKNPLSTATGLGQFTESTWLATLRAHRPDLVQGRSRAEQLALRTDGALSKEMTGHLLDDNFAQLDAAGVPLTPMTGYLAHHFGAGRVGKMLAKPDAQIESILSKAEMDANPSYRGKTVGEVMASFEARAAKKGVRARELDVPATAARLPEVPQTFVPPRTGAEAGLVIDRTLTELDAASEAVLPPARVKALDRELEQIAAALRKNDQAERAGIVRADPRSRITPERRAELGARQTEIRGELEAHRSAVAQATRAEDLRGKLSKIDLDSDLVALSEKLSPSVRRPTNARPQPAPTAKAAPPAKLPDTPVQAGPPPIASAAARSNVVPIRKPAAAAAALPEVASVRTVADQQPGMAVIAGADADGAPVYASLADTLDEIEATHQQQLREADAYDAAVACFLRRG